MQRLELRKTNTNNYSIAVDGKIADGLTIDEAMGCLASALFAQAPLFVRDLGDHFRWRAQYSLTITDGEQDELVKMSDRTMPKSLPAPDNDIPLF